MPPGVLRAARCGTGRYARLEQAVKSELRSGGYHYSDSPNSRRLNSVAVGMTREQVLMALAYPPAHRTPHLEGQVWTYWVDRDDTFRVYFDGDRVSRVSRRGGAARSGRRRRRD